MAGGLGRMWKYWLYEKNGGNYVAALENHYRRTLSESHALMHAYQQIKMAQASVDAEMEKLAERQLEDGTDTA